MKKHSLAAFLVAAVLAFQAQAASYVGASTGTTNGAAGVIAMSALCNARYVAARMCFYDEVTLSIHRGTDSHGAAWVNPGLLQSTPPKPNCGNWSSLSTGSTIDGAGKLSVAGCNAVLPVACCR